MGAYKDLSGQAHGDLLVLSRSYVDKGGNTYYLCRCACGREWNVRSTHISSGLVQRCKQCGIKKQAETKTGRKLGPYLNGTKTKIDIVCPICGKVFQNWESQKQKYCSRKCRSTIHGQSYTKEYKAGNLKRYNDQKKHSNAKWTQDMELTLRSFQSVCVVCGKTQDENIAECGRILEVDHLFPVSKGGLLYPGTAVVLCRYCNGSKADKLPSDLPEPMRSLILEAAESFRLYWEETHP